MRRVLFLGMITLTVNSCGVLRPKPTSDIKVTNAKDLIEQIQTTQSSWNTLDMRGSVTALQGDASQRISTSIRIRANELIWVNAAMIVPVGRAKIDKTGVSFYEQNDCQNRIVYRTPNRCGGASATTQWFGNQKWNHSTQRPWHD